MGTYYVSVREYDKYGNPIIRRQAMKSPWYTPDSIDSLKKLGICETYLSRATRAANLYNRWIHSQGRDKPINPLSTDMDAWRKIPAYTTEAAPLARYKVKMAAGWTLLSDWYRPDPISSLYIPAGTLPMKACPGWPSI